MHLSILWIMCAAALALVVMRIDWTPGRYKIGYHEGDDLNLKTVMRAGILTIENSGIRIHGDTDLQIPFSAVEGLKIGPYTGIRRLFRLTFEGRKVSFAVVRFMIGGQFLQGDYFKARRLESKLAEFGLI
jgi:hypothetical protein